ncbi:MAG: hypothetical protein GF421_10835 [Candidatus Aminicenantes bacterium]|nr:hypothetical protein [Candidatus Aminicenantes bacterium]
MNCQNIREKFTGYLTGEISKKEKERIQTHVRQCKDCREELESLTEIWTKLGVLKEKQPSPQLRTRFYSMLEDYKQSETKKAKKEKIHLLSWLKNLWPRRPAFQFALSLGILVLGLVIGNLWTVIPRQNAITTALVDEVRGMRQALAVSLIDQESASERLQGINMSYSMADPDEELLDKLLSTLKSDPSVSVRLAAVDALYLFHNHPKVKQGLIDSLSQQSSPMIQAALIDLMVSIRERRAVDALKSLLDSEDVNPEIKDRAEQGIQRLSF